MYVGICGGGILRRSEIATNPQRAHDANRTKHQRRARQHPSEPLFANPIPIHFRPSSKIIAA
jgi:hypothetical protein